MQCLLHPDVHPRTLLTKSLDLLYQLLLQNMLIHPLERCEIQYTISAVLESLRFP